MRLIKIVSLILFLFHSYSFSDTEYTQQQMKDKIIGYGTMQGIGLTFLGGGGASMVTGIILMASCDWETHTTPTGIHKTTDDPKGEAGIKALLIGIPFTICGTVLGIIGTKKKKEYKRRIKWSGIKLRKTPNFNSCEFVFSF